jgi:DNA-binding transcriptional LysR family regulator
MDPDWYPTLSRLSLQQLLSFLLVAQEKSFRAAGHRMHISQSAVSVQIQQLESFLGVSLFHRTTRNVSLTPEGELLASVAQRVVRELHAVSHELSELAQLQRGIAKVAALPTFAHQVLPPLMGRYLQQHPGMEIRLHDLDSAAALKALEKAEVDFAVLGRTGELGLFEFIPMFDDELVVLAPDQPQALQGTVSVQELARQKLLLTPPGAQVRSLVDALFGQFQCKPQVVQECFRPQTLLALVEQGLGVTVLPRSAVPRTGLSGIRVVELETRLVRQICVVTRSHQSLSPAAASFRDFLLASRPQGSGLGRELPAVPQPDTVQSATGTSDL